MEWNKLVPECVVSNYAESKKFYVHVLGFRLMFERPENGFGYFDLDGAQIMLLEREQSEVPRSIHTSPNKHGFHFQVEVEKWEPLLIRLAAQGISLRTPVIESWYRVDDIEHGQNEFFVGDLDGFQFRFYEPLGERPFKS